MTDIQVGQQYRYRPPMNGGRTGAGVDAVVEIIRIEHGDIIYRVISFAPGSYEWRSVGTTGNVGTDWSEYLTPIQQDSNQEEESTVTERVLYTRDNLPPTGTWVNARVYRQTERVDVRITDTDLDGYEVYGLDINNTRRRIYIPHGRDARPQDEAYQVTDPSLVADAPETGRTYNGTVYYDTLHVPAVGTWVEGLRRGEFSVNERIVGRVVSFPETRRASVKLADGTDALVYVPVPDSWSDRHANADFRLVRVNAPGTEAAPATEQVTYYHTNYTPPVGALVEGASWMSGIRVQGVVEEVDTQLHRVQIAVDSSTRWVRLPNERPFSEWPTDDERLCSAVASAASDFILGREPVNGSWVEGYDLNADERAVGQVRYSCAYHVHVTREDGERTTFVLPSTAVTTNRRLMRATRPGTTSVVFSALPESTPVDAPVQFHKNNLPSVGTWVEGKPLGTYNLRVVGQITDVTEDRAVVRRASGATDTLYVPYEVSNLDRMTDRLVSVPVPDRVAGPYERVYYHTRHLPPVGSWVNGPWNEDQDYRYEGRVISVHGDEEVSIEDSNGDIYTLDIPVDEDNWDGTESYALYSIPEGTSAAAPAMPTEETLAEFRIRVRDRIRQGVRNDEICETGGRRFLTNLELGGLRGEHQFTITVQVETDLPRDRVASAVNRMVIDNEHLTSLAYPTVAPRQSS